MKDNRVVKGALALFVVVLAVLYLIGWYGHVADGEGVVVATWPEYHTSSSCDVNHNCSSSSSATYYVKFDNGNTFDLHWGWWQWVGLHQGARVRYSARGYEIWLLWWRVATPTIFSYQVLK